MKKDNPLYCPNCGAVLTWRLERWSYYCPSCRLTFRPTLMQRCEEQHLPDFNCYIKKHSEF